MDESRVEGDAVVVADHDAHRRGGGWVPLPAVAPDADVRPGSISIDVDGERFAVRQTAEGGWAYEWLSGPNPGYGFATSGPLISTVEEHRTAIRSFLSMIDPATGYIGDD